MLRSFLFAFMTVWLLDQFVPGFELGSNIPSLALTTLALIVINYIVVPILSIIFLPINIITVGLFKWVLTAAATYVLVKYASFIVLSDWTFQGFTMTIPFLDSLPPLFIKQFEFKFWENIALLAISYNLIFSFLNWLSRDSD